MFTITQIKEHLIGLSHGGTLNKIRNIEAMLERSASKLMLKMRILETMNTVPLSSTIHDDIFNYSLPYNFGLLIDLYPQDNRMLWDKSFRNKAGQFDREKAVRNKTISIEANNGVKTIRINWKSRQNKVLNSMNTYDGNGTWIAVGSATSIVTDSITKYSGSGSVRFNVPTTGGGIQNTTMTAVDLTDENGVSDTYIAVYLDTDYANLTSITPTWGNDLTTKYWSGVAQTTQADGTAFKYGWNIIKAPWVTATQTGTVAAASIDSYKLVFTTSGALANIRVDNVIFSIGRNFDIKFYSKYLYKSASTGLWISQPTSDDDYVAVDNDSLPHYLMEVLKDMAHQVEGTDSSFDIKFAESELMALFPAYRANYPGMAVKTASGYGNRNPARGRW